MELVDGIIDFSEQTDFIDILFFLERDILFTHHHHIDTTIKKNVLDFMTVVGYQYMLANNI